MVRQPGLYAVVISLVTHAMPSNRLRTALLRLLVALAILFWAGSLLVHQEVRVSLWMSRVVRNLSFCSAIVNMALWFVLIPSQPQDSSLPLITAPLAIQLTR